MVGILAVLAVAASTLPGQSVTVTGRIEHGVRGTPLRAQWAVLHRVARGGAGPVDSARTDRAGRYRLRLPAAEVAAAYQVSTLYQGIAYFSEQLTLADRVEAAFQPISVFDTARAGAPIRLARRLVTLARPGSDGARSVLEILELENPGPTIRITDDTSRPVWSGALPAAAVQFRAGEGDVSPDAVLRRGDSVAVFAPLAPGDVQQLSYSYVLPGDVRALALPIDQWTGQVNLLLEDTLAAVRGPLLDTIGVQAIEERRFAAYRIDSLAAGTFLTIALSPRPFRAQRLVPVIVGLAAAALVAGLVVALRRKTSDVRHQTLGVAI